MAPAAAPDFSDAAVQQLSEALQRYVASWNEERHESLRAALERICAEAHAAELGPERMLVAVKEAWLRIPVFDRADVERSRMAWERVVGYCIEAYYPKG